MQDAIDFGNAGPSAASRAARPGRSGPAEFSAAPIFARRASALHEDAEPGRGRFVERGLSAPGGGGRDAPSFSSPSPARAAGAGASEMVRTARHRRKKRNARLARAHGFACAAWPSKTGGPRIEELKGNARISGLAAHDPLGPMSQQLRLCLHASRQKHDQPPHGGFGGAQRAGDHAMQPARDAARRGIFGQSEHGEQARDDAREGSMGGGDDGREGQDGALENVK